MILEVYAKQESIKSIKKQNKKNIIQLIAINKTKTFSLYYLKRKTKKKYWMVIDESPVFIAEDNLK